MAPARTLASSAASDASPIRASAARTAKCKHKPKGIPRAKTGCYTCRIRRKVRHDPPHRAPARAGARGTELADTET